MTVVDTHSDILSKVASKKIARTYRNKKRNFWPKQTCTLNQSNCNTNRKWQIKAEKSGCQII